MQQNAGATYDAANHLGTGTNPTDIGQYGALTIIDANQYGYGGRVVFDGQYRLRGTVRLINGTFELRPGTVFYASGRSGRLLPGVSSADYQAHTVFIEVENATLEMRGATIEAACDLSWGGIRLFDNGIIRTDADPGTGRRCAIKDAWVAVNATAQTDLTQYFTAFKCQYYLNQTDFLNNSIGVNDQGKGGVARAGEGVHRCSFSIDVASLRFPFQAVPPQPMQVGQQFLGIGFFPFDDVPSDPNVDYASASIDNNVFHHLNTGISGTARNLRIFDNTFDYVQTGITVPGLGFRNSTYSSGPMYVERNTITLRGHDRYFYGLTGIFGNVYMAGNVITGDDPNPAAHPQTMVGIEVNEIDGTTQTNNTLAQLNVGVSVLLPRWRNWGVGDVSGNRFRDCQFGMRFGTSIYSGFGRTDELRLRCNTFQNPARLPNSIGLYVSPNMPQFPDDLGTMSDPNGNKFGTNNVLESNFTPFVNNSGKNTPVRYFRYGASTQEVILSSSVIQVRTAGGNPAYACSPYNAGINARSAVPTAASVSPLMLQLAQDSLRLIKIPAVRRNALVGILTDEAAKAPLALEEYTATLPNPAGETHAALATWLLSWYSQHNQPADAQRTMAVLRRWHSTDPEVANNVLLFEATRALRPARHETALAPPPPTVLAQLRTVAQSGTGAAWAACRIVQRYDPRCACRLETVNESAAGFSELAGPAKSPLALQAYPNPANEALNVAYTLNSSPARLEVRDVLGRVVYALNLQPARGRSEMSVPVRELPAGLYNVALLITGQPIATQRVAVQH